PLVPSLHLMYQPNEFYTLRASYGLGFRAPSLKELFLDFQDSNHDITGNPNLRPETGHNVQVSSSITFKRNHHKLELQPGAFFNCIMNKIDLKVSTPSLGAAPGVVAYKYDNFKRVITYGGEFNTNYFWKQLSLSAGVQLTQIDTRDESLREKIISNLVADVIARAGYLIPKAKIQMNVFYKYTGRRALFSLNSSYSTGFVNPFHSIDITFMRNFWRDRIQVTLGGKNLANITNVATQNASGAGHSVGAGGNLMINRGRTFFVNIALQFAR
ncbi:MAG: TonB-dependent receptor, partial [Chitinophagales bacterium]|nr:TonB-dependent receptor [Chitinophagales bacterium]